MAKLFMKPVPFYDNYMASTNGNILNCHRNSFLKPILRAGGYLAVDLSDKGVVKRHYIHRLIMLTFIGSSNLDVNHKNGIKKDNRLFNLEYCSKKENLRHAHRTGLKTGVKGEKSHLAKLKKQEVKEIKQSNLSQRKLAKQYNVTHQCIGAIKRGITWKNT